MPAILFDLDGVLIDSERLQHKAYAAVLDRFGVRITRDEYGMQWTGAGGGAEYAVEKYSLPITAAEIRAIKGPVYHDILEHEIEAMPGVGAALERLAPHFALAVATNSGRTDVDFVLKRLGLTAYFKACVTREDYGNAKPEPDAFLLAAAQLSTPPPHCLVVEDAYKGVVAARRAGCRVVVIPNAYTRHNDFGLAHLQLKHLDELTLQRIDAVFRMPVSS